MKEEIRARVEEIVKSLDVATIATMDEEGFPRASTISSIRVEGLKTFWFSTGLTSGKVKCLQKDNKASICYQKDGNNVTLMGTIEILTDADIKKALWVDWFIDHFSQGPTDPNYCILKFTARKGVLWVDWNYLEFDQTDI